MMNRLNPKTPLRSSATVGLSVLAALLLSTLASAVMAPMAKALSAQDRADVAACYVRLQGGAPAAQP